MVKLENTMSKALEHPEVPSVAAAVIHQDSHEIAVLGVRRLGEDKAVERGDKYHIGSCGKAITATLAARLVEAGLVDWETQILDVFEEVVVHPDYQRVTLRQLLNHTAGFPMNPITFAANIPRGLVLEWIRAKAQDAITSRVHLGDSERYHYPETVHRTASLHPTITMKHPTSLI